MTHDGAPGADDATATPPDVPAPTPGGAGRTGGRVLRGALLVASLAAVVGLDTGVVPLPASTAKPVVRTVAGGASAAPKYDAAADAARQKALRTTLTALGAALAGGNGTAAGALVDPAYAATGKALGVLAKNLHALPSTDVSLEWAGVWTPDGTTSPNDAVVAHALVKTFVRGYDLAPGGDHVDVGMRRHGTQWLVTSWTWSKAEAPPPWTIPGLQAVTKPHVVVIGQAKNAGVNARLASRAEAAAVDARSLWKVPGWNGRAVLVATTDTGYLDTWFGTGKAGPGQPSADRFNAYVTTPGDGTSTATGFRTVLGTDFLLRDNRATRSDLRYMFTILAMQSSSDDLLPAWLYYGSADYTAWRAQGRTDPLETLRARGLADGTWSALRRRTWRPQLTDSQSTFAEGSKAKIANDWDSAFFTVAYIVDTYGEKTLTGLLVDIGSGTATDAALRTRLHLTQDQLTAKVRAYARPLAARA